MLAVYVL